MDDGERCYRRFLQGDEEAFNGVIDCYYDHLTFFINRYVHDLPAAEDLAIDALLQLMIHPGRYRPEASLKTYLFTLGRNRALNYLKRRRRETPMGESDAEQQGDLISLEQAVLQNEQRRQLSAAMETLPEEERTVLHLIYFEGMSYREAAKTMKKNPKQVDNLLYRAKARLRDALGEEGAQLL